MYVWCPQDVDEFFQTEREHNHVLTGCSKSAAEVNLEAVGLTGQRGASEYQTHDLCCFSLQRFLDVVQTEQSEDPNPNMKTRPIITFAVFQSWFYRHGRWVIPEVFLTCV